MSNALTQRNEEMPVAMGFGNRDSFEFLQRTAKMFCASSMVPAAYQETITKGYGQKAKEEHNPAALANCVIALDMSQRMSANPLMIMQNLHIIEGRPSWSSQFIIAAINNCGKFSPLRFDLEWLDEIDANFSTFEWEDGRKNEKKHKIRIKNARCVAWATEKATGERLESAPVTMEMAVNEGWYGKNGSKWKSMPDLMMRYRSAAFFGRIYAPELLMGLPSSEEAHDIITVDQDGTYTEERVPVGRTSNGTVDPTTGEITPAGYPADKFEANLATWTDVITSGRKTADKLIEFAQSRAPTTLFTAEQIARLRALEPDIATDAVEKVKGKGATTQAAEDKPAAEVIGEKTYAQVRHVLEGAATFDELYAAADQIPAVRDMGFQKELEEIYEQRRAAMAAVKEPQP